MKREIDARGLSCPQPVILAREAMKEFDELEILVDNNTALENLARLASSSGWNFSSETADHGSKIIMTGTIVRAADEISGQPEIACKKNRQFAVVLASDVMGTGDNELGAVLMKAFVHTLASSGEAPSSVLLYNSGVRLAAENSGVLDDLQLLENQGSEILVCGTCVNYYGLEHSIRAGKISNMYDILDSMKNPDNIIRP